MVNPPSGTANVVLTSTASNSQSGAAICFSGVDTVSPFGTFSNLTANVNAITQSYTQARTNSWLLVGGSHYANTSISWDAALTQNWRVASPHSVVNAQAYADLTSGAKTFSNTWAGTFGWIVQYVVELNSVDDYVTPTMTSTATPTSTPTPTNVPSATIVPTLTPAPKPFAAPLPPMGFIGLCDGYTLGGGLTQAQFEAESDALITSGLQAAGYNMTMLDAGWKSANRHSDGRPIPNASFPDMAGLVDHIHANGQLAGIYTGYGYLDCGGTQYGSLGWEYVDAQQFANWGFDYIKIDSCYNTGLDAQIQYTLWANAIFAAGLSVGKTIIFSLNQSGLTSYESWAFDISHMARGAQDMENTYVRMIGNFRELLGMAPYSGPGKWSNLDVLHFEPGGMTIEQKQGMMDIWCISASPLFLWPLKPSEVTSTAGVFDIMTNPYTLSVNQDPLGQQGYLISGSVGAGMVLLKRMSKPGQFAVCMLNDSATDPKSMTVSFASMTRTGEIASVFRTDDKTDLGFFTGSYTQNVASAEAVLLLLQFPVEETRHIYLKRLLSPILSPPRW